LRVALSEQFAATAGDEILIIETGAPFTHARGLSPGPRQARKPQARLVTQAFSYRKRSASGLDQRPGAEGGEDAALGA
jgi:hypothetical protein